MIVFQITSYIPKTIHISLIKKSKNRIKFTLNNIIIINLNKSLSQIIPSNHKNTKYIKFIFIYTFLNKIKKK